MKIACIGGGNMVSAIVAGLVKTGINPMDITVKDPHPEKLARLHETYGISTADALGDWVTKADLLLLGVKPQALEKCLDEVRPLISPETTVLSIAAAVTAQTLKKWTGSKRIIRTLPNTPAMVSKGFTGMFACDTALPVDKERAQSVMQAVGRIVWVTNEEMLHTVTGGPGSGPAYVFLFMQGLEEALMNQGADKASAHEMALSTVEGAAALARQSAEEFATLRQNVTSRGGTTAKAVEAFEAADFRGTIDAAVKACVARSKEMAELFR